VHACQRRYQGAVSTIIDQLQARGVSMLVVMSLTCKTATRFQVKPSWSCRLNA